MFQPNVEDGGDKGNGRENQEIQQKRERERDNGNVIDENDDSNVSGLQKYAEM